MTKNAMFDSRRHLLDSLKPPPGCELTDAVGTSFSLDLMTLMTAPLAFTFFEWEGEDGGKVVDPIALMEALRRQAARIDLFCQAGRIQVPKPDQRMRRRSLRHPFHAHGHPEP